MKWLESGVTFSYACCLDIKNLKSRMDVIFGFELLWKIAILHVVALAAYCILRTRNMEGKSKERGKDCWQSIKF